MDDRPIGVFDSGFGGLTVARAMIDLLPGENLVYVGDTGRYPYGPRPLDEVRGFARQITAKLVASTTSRWSWWPATPRPPPASTSCAPSTDVPLSSVIEPGPAGRPARHRDRAGSA